MGQVIISGGAGGGVTSDELTTTKEYVVKGKTYVGSDTNDEIGTGTLELTGTATSQHVLANKSFYNTNPLIPSTGSMVDRGVVDSSIGGINSNYPTVAIHRGDNPQIGTTAVSKEKMLAIRPPHGYYNGNSYVGILATLLGDAASSNVLSGKYFTSVNGIKVKGTMTVNSLTSFKVAVSSGANVTITWTVPTAASGKPFSGIHVRYKTGSAPTSISDGTAIYTGNNSVSSGTTSVTVTMPALSTAYYFSAWAYATINNSKVYSSTYKTANCTTQAVLQKTFTSTQNYTIPAGYKKIDIFCVGGGGSGAPNSYYSGGGGGGGYTRTVTGISVTPGTTYAVTVGSGGTTGNGGASSFGTLCSADGGKTGVNGGAGGDGGSGGGSSMADGHNANYYGLNGGTNGGNGGNITDTSATKYKYAGKGQGSTTKPFGASSGTTYSGGGGGGSNGYAGWAFVGGNYGGGNGGISGYDDSDHRLPATAGTANSGGGGGGGSYSKDSEDDMQWQVKGAAGGSGIVIIKLYV